MSDRNPKSAKPYFVAGAGRLMSTVWKSSDAKQGFEYGFNLVVLKSDDGAVSSRFEPGDLLDMVKLSGLLAFELAVDGCLDEGLRRELIELADGIDCLLEGQAEGE